MFSLRLSTLHPVSFAASVCELDLLDGDFGLAGSAPFEVVVVGAGAEFVAPPDPEKVDHYGHEEEYRDEDYHDCGVGMHCRGECLSAVAGDRGQCGLIGLYWFVWGRVYFDFMRLH